ncbi:hypothetical protein CSC94_12780 [Zhengella mangrovi]|uniref:Baseplate protein J-like domain-containing protein n=1 Tax=Zhengella mangrovi TaxID=1982044 RepID=A0A2G1QMW3_9HYPH|nr:hypothetical protein [Zhengella mangrovi]PHP66558.1 hypothetical protein CSC94_12780 [Zhengella mangrovi]
MSDYGVKPTGWARKPLSVILAETEAAMITEFGPDVIQTAQSPLGQINGLFANLAAQVEELAEDVYHSYDPDQAEGLRLDALARIRQIARNGRGDPAMRKAITNEGVARVDLADILAAVRSVDGVTYAAVYTNETNLRDDNGLDPGSVAIVVIGGDDEAIAYEFRQFIAPGTIMFGTTYISTTRDGLCRSIAIVRPIVVPVDLSISVRVRKDINGCPPPATADIGAAFLADWAENNANGKDVNAYNIRALVEGRFSNVEVVSVLSSRDNNPETASSAIAFIEISEISQVEITVL